MEVNKIKLKTTSSYYIREMLVYYKNYRSILKKICLDSDLRESIIGIAREELGASHIQEMDEIYLWTMLGRFDILPINLFQIFGLFMLYPNTFLYIFRYEKWDTKLLSLIPEKETTSPRFNTTPKRDWRRNLRTPTLKLSGAIKSDTMIGFTKLTSRLAISETTTTSPSSGKCEETMLNSSTLRRDTRLYFDWSQNLLSHIFF